MTVTARDRRIIDVTRDTDEPTICFRAQDRFSMEALFAYREAIEGKVDDDFLAVVDATLVEFQGWQHDNQDRVKVPDL